MLAVGPLGPQYCQLFARYELGRQAIPGCRHPPYPEGTLKKMNQYFLPTSTNAADCPTILMASPESAG